MEQPVWLVTGANRGFGSEFVKAAISRGYRVAATARNPQSISETYKDNDNVAAVSLDVTDQNQIKHAVQSVIDTFGRIDVLVNNAGYGLFGSLEETTDEETRALYDTNVFGMMNVTRAVLPYMRAQRSGRIVNVGSAASLICDPGGALYDSSKAAIAAVSEVLRLEMADFGVESMTITPGMFRTNFFDESSIKRPQHAMDAYDQSSARSAEQYCLDHNYQQKNDPGKAAELVCDIVSSPYPLPAWLPLGKDAVKKFERKLQAMLDELQPYKEAASNVFVD